MGGIIGSVQTAPAHCSNTANISLKRGSYSSTNVSYIGGIAGYQVTGTRNFVDLHHNGTIHTSETHYCYASGIIGYTNGSCTYDACSVEGSISCLDHNPGLFYSTPDGTTKTITFRNSCTVKSGTTLIGSSGTTTISAVADFTATRVIGGGGSSTSPTYANLSVN